MKKPFPLFPHGATCLSPPPLWCHRCSFWLRLPSFWFIQRQTQLMLPLSGSQISQQSVLPPEDKLTLVWCGASHNLIPHLVPAPVLCESSPAPTEWRQHSDTHLSGLNLHLGHVCQPSSPPTNSPTEALIKTMSSTKNIPVLPLPTCSGNHPSFDLSSLQTLPTLCWVSWPWSQRLTCANSLSKVCSTHPWAYILNFILLDNDSSKTGKNYLRYR